MNAAAVQTEPHTMSVCIAFAILHIGTLIYLPMKHKAHRYFYFPSSHFWYLNESGDSDWINYKKQPTREMNISSQWMSHFLDFWLKKKQFFKSLSKINSLSFWLQECEHFYASKGWKLSILFFSDTKFVFFLMKNISSVEIDPLNRS